ncbi:MAG: ATP-dependent RNA helicase [Spirochaetaceae bacterium]|jgi:HrpA-like RNA helicase|nr:ATP-dependent RNA helicase [Spirochaetaceae bacterium]
MKQIHGINYQELPVYAQKERILETLRLNKIIVVQSPTGSGKTTQIPVILHEAGYTGSLAVAVTQPRRIAAVSVSEFIARQLNTTFPGLVGYKMRFEDKTNADTRIKIMTDGILLQEMKFDPYLTKYSVVMVDEAHERSLNIDFILGLLKRIVNEREDFRVVISSATMNAEAFSHYFDGAPIVTIDTITYPVNVIYDPLALGEKPKGQAGRGRKGGGDAGELLCLKIEETIARVIDNGAQGAILCFLPGEKSIKDCCFLLRHSPLARQIYVMPLYGRLSKEEQEQVFYPPPPGKRKVIVSTNIAETSVTIGDVTTVIDSGLAKLNYYNPHTYTSSLLESLVSKASSSQRKGRAGRTAPGTCYRLYSRKDFDSRPLYTMEEIYRTDLSEVVLRMAELGIIDFENFEFISPPGKEGIEGAVETLLMLKALNEDHSLSKIGALMVEFPLLPRQSRIIVEAILEHPDVLEEVITATAFLSTNSPFILPAGKEMDARKAHHAFRDMNGDFGSYLRLFKTYSERKDKVKFCEQYYLDPEVMGEIYNIKDQLEQIVAKLGIPIMSGGSFDDYLCCIAAGMIQFVCVRTGKDNYRSLTTENIQIHPGSSIFRTSPLYIVAGEIFRTSRMFAMSVSPLTRALLRRIDSGLEAALAQAARSRGRTKAEEAQARAEAREAARAAKAEGNVFHFGGETFAIKKIKGKKHLMLPYDEFMRSLRAESSERERKKIAQYRGAVLIGDKTLLQGEKLSFIIRLAEALDFTPVTLPEGKLTLQSGKDGGDFLSALELTLRVCPLRSDSGTLGFAALLSDGRGNYRLKPHKGFSSALSESLSSFELLIDDEAGLFTEAQKDAVGAIYRRISELYQ